ncbi:MAG TPA: tyrosine-type recombinase/integrase, partial [Sphingobacteriaceae bacterium]
MIESFLKYLRFQKRVSDHTVLAYQTDLTQLENYFSENFPDDRLENASFGHLRAWLVALVDSGLEPVSVNRKIATLRSFYKFLLREEKITKDPTAKIRVLKTKKKLPSFIKVSEINDAIDAVDSSTNETEFIRVRNKLIVELFYSTGIRLAELLGLNDANVDLVNTTIKVLGKRNKERVIPFPRNLAKVIKAYQQIRNREVGKKDHTSFFVTEDGDPCYPALIYRVVKRSLSNTSADKRSPHVLRHTFAT